MRACPGHLTGKAYEQLPTCTATVSLTVVLQQSAKAGVGASCDLKVTPVPSRLDRQGPQSHRGTVYAAAGRCADYCSPLQPTNTDAVLLLARVPTVRPALPQPSVHRAPGPHLLAEAAPQSRHGGQQPQVAQQQRRQQRIHGGVADLQERAAWVPIVRVPRALDWRGLACPVYGLGSVVWPAGPRTGVTARVMAPALAHATPTSPNRRCVPVR